MQDLKHLSRKKSLSSSDLFRLFRKNRRLKPAREQVSQQLSPPAGRRLQRIKYILIFLVITLGLAPACFVLLKNNQHTLQQLFSRDKAPLKPSEASRKAPVASSFEQAYALLASASLAGNQLTAGTADRRQIAYTINPSLQQRVHDFLQANQVPYAVFVAIEPSSGRILAMTAHSAIDPAWADTSFFELYPMASLFKIITASAALENRKITPATVVEFRGNSYSENPRYWSALPHGRNNRLDVTYAMGKSINPVYGRVACDIAGKKSVMECVDRFGFNQTIFPGVPVKTSQAAEPESDHGLMLMGAGLNHEVKISPLHAASIISAIANGGRMMAPDLAETILDEKGNPKGQFTPRELRRLVTAETAASLSRMLSSTVLTGTSRKAFHDRRGRLLVDVPVAAKTGSINGDNPRGHYSWFAAYAPIDNPKIAMVALVINPDKWKIKASQVGQQALSAFFGR